MEEAELVPIAMNRFICCLIGACLSLTIQAWPLRLDGKNPKERGAAMLSYVANLKPDPGSETYPTVSAPLYAARLVLNVDTAYALAKLDAAAAHQIAKRRDRIARKSPGSVLDPCDKAALVNTYFLGKDKIPQAIRPSGESGEYSRLRRKRFQPIHAARGHFVRAVCRAGKNEGAQPGVRVSLLQALRAISRHGQHREAYREGRLGVLS